MLKSDNFLRVIFVTLRLAFEWRVGVVCDTAQIAQTDLDDHRSELRLVAVARKLFVFACIYLVSGKGFSALQPVPCNVYGGDVQFDKT